MALSFVLTTQAFAGHLTKLNNELVGVLNQYQDQNTQVSLTFKKIKTDETRALDVQLAMDFKKSGVGNTVDLNLNNVEYKYGDGSAPTTLFDTAIGLNLTKIFPQADLNGMIPQFADLLKQEASQLGALYGTAIQIDVNVTDATPDAQGNYKTLKAEISAKIDMDKLPQSIEANTVMFTSAHVNLDLDVATGVKLSGNLVSNPKYVDFQTDQLGLKGLLDKLVACDSKTLQQVSHEVSELNDLITKVTGGPADAQSSLTSLFSSF
jgi:hypothetical protein